MEVNERKEQFKKKKTFFNLERKLKNNFQNKVKNQKKMKTVRETITQGIQQGTNQQVPSMQLQNERGTQYLELFK